MFRRIEADTSSILKEANMHEDILRQNMQRLEEVPFDSDRKLMSTKYMLHGVPTILTKGAVDVLLDRCDYVRCSDGIRPMTEAEKNRIHLPVRTDLEPLQSLCFRRGSLFTGTGYFHPGTAQCIQRSRSDYVGTRSDRRSRSHADSDYTDNENYQA